MSITDPRNETEAKQRRASDPQASAFVAANAGSGKTYVLVKRILRLLVNGVDPSKILALTYTTAAAANMSNRVFRDLARWVNLNDEELARELTELDGTTPSASRINAARRLFARAVETPGGLKIQTIHAFCERVLHIFPFEANVPAGFVVLDDKAQKDRLAAARLRIIGGTSTSDPALALALTDVIDITDEKGFEQILDTALPHRHDLQNIIKQKGSIAALTKEIRAALGLAPDETLEDVNTALYAERLSTPITQDMIGALRAHGIKTDLKLAERLAQSLHLPRGETWEALYLDLFLTKDFEPRVAAKAITNSVNNARPDIRVQFVEEQQRILPLLDRRKAHEAVERTESLLLVTHAVARLYEAEKTQAGALDFDDLIARTRALLERTSARWVLYKLDRGIDHLLVDEAQDTSPAQWDILKALTDEFHSGEGARPQNRSVFAVGDPKQSIYSFQGAEPDAFFESRAHFQKRVQADGRSAFYPEELTVSFRSAPDVLKAVDAIFSEPHRFRGLEREARPTIHESQRRNAPGRVELWPLIEPIEVTRTESWTAPLDEPGAASPPVRLARAVAQHIKGLVAPHSAERLVDDDGKPRRIKPGDILILVRSRSVFFETVIRALKEEHLPVAGADRLLLQGHIAAMDLMVLGEAMLTPDDDLALATLLKSPLIGLDDDALIRLAPERAGSLADALDQIKNDRALEEARDKIARLREAAHQLHPFAFYAFVLGPFGGRRAMRARFGPEAEDAMDEFLRLALDHEQKQAPSLRVFLAEFRASTLAIKRDMDAERDEIRVMTVHGAKGLEAPIIYLPDTAGAAVDARRLDPIFDLGRGTDAFIPVWSPSKATDSERLATARREAIMREEDEHRRLLYVALTRPRDRLYIAGTTVKGKRRDGNWYDMIAEGLNPHLVDVTDETAPAGARRLASGEMPKGDTTRNTALSAPAPLPSWLFQDATPERPSQPPLRPSNALDAAERPDRPETLSANQEARRRGILIHALLERLPRIETASRADVALTWLAAKAGDLPSADREAIAKDAMALMELPALGPLFGPEARAEVPISGTLTGNDGTARRVSGQIDRLAITADAVFIADFKTTARPATRLEEIDEKTLTQLAVYQALLAALDPSKPIKTLVIYTATQAIFEIPPARLAESLVQIGKRPSLDGAGARS